MTATEFRKQLAVCYEKAAAHEPCIIKHAGYPNVEFTLMEIIRERD